MSPGMFLRLFYNVTERALTGTTFDQLAVFCLQKRLQCYLAKLVLIFFV